ncbi:MAG TPA: hypothetical protein VFI24_10150 [Pyrinomonadaceae bacterium]|nr:hypothetical protein [Pyrinomonadaceae bacterium]
MLDELRAILTREGITTAAIIDDVYDDIPTSHDIDDESWGFFLDDHTDDDVAIIREGYGTTDPESRWPELRGDDSFIKFLWERRAESEILQALFRTFIERQRAGKAQLEPLRVLLFDDLKLQGGAYGANAQEEVDAQLLFLDLFLGAQQDEAARNKALNRVKATVDLRREAPPLLVLMSSSARLHQMRDEFRDDAELMGCQFRTLQKASLENLAEVYELLYRLTSTYRNSLLLSSFLELWHQALEKATTRFLKTARRLDLRDYADLQTMVLNAEDEMIGAYLLEVFGKYFQFELEEDGRLSAAALKLNEMEFDSYPAPHFLPAPVSADIADGVLFRSSKILSKSEPLQFGDVLFSTRVDALGEGTEPSANFAIGERIALLALTAACDLQHGYAKRLFFIAGVAKPSELLLHKRPDALLTPILMHEGKPYVIEWDVGAPVAWSLNDLEKHLNLETPSFERVRRFRSLFSLQLQQRFTSSLSRVGTPVMPPMQHVTGATISYRDTDGLLHSLVATTRADRKAVLLVGRDERKLVDRLVLDSEIVSDLKIQMQKVQPDNVAASQRQKWAVAIQNREMFSTMEQGLSYSRSGLERSFKGKEYDILTIVGPYVEEGTNPISAQRTIQDQRVGPLIIELNLELQ